jgi:hypothetical protein
MSYLSKMSYRRIPSQNVMDAPKRTEHKLDHAVRVGDPVKNLVTTKCLFEGANHFPVDEMRC